MNNKNPSFLSKGLHHEIVKSSLTQIKRELDSEDKSVNCEKKLKKMRLARMERMERMMMDRKNRKETVLFRLRPKSGENRID